MPGRFKFPPRLPQYLDGEFRGALSGAGILEEGQRNHAPPCHIGVAIVALLTG
jgi:hypothetical protein